MQAVLAALRAEFRKRQANGSVQELNAGREATRKQGTAGFIGQLGPQDVAQSPTLAPLLCESEAAGGQVIRDDEAESPAAFVIPLNGESLRRFMNRVCPDPATEIPRAFLEQLRAVFAGGTDPVPPPQSMKGPDTAEPGVQTTPY